MRTKSTSVLVILVYWTAHHDSVTPAQAKRVVVTDAGAWYRAASYGHQTLTGTATPWFKIAKQKCGFEFGTINAAKATAKKHGYNVAKYGRIVIYEPCGKGTETGTGEIGGNIVVLSSTDDLNLATAVHEQGHNYGLNHANLWGCGLHGAPVTYLAKASCSEAEYQDFSSAMGAELGTEPNLAGDFTAPQKYQLGWLSGHVVTVKGSQTVALAPYETKPGLKAARIPGSSGRTYWLEYRTAVGNDTKLDPLRLGVIVHMSFPKDGAMSQSLVLPMVTEPDDGSGFGVVKEKEFALLPGSSWTSPEGIELTVRAQTPGLATVVVQRHKTPGKPGAVTGLTITPLDQAAAVTFHRAPDNGLVVHNYIVEDGAGDPVADLSDYTSSPTLNVTLDNLNNGIPLSVSVRAVNDLGTGPSAQSGVVTPAPIPPVVTITAPAPGASVARSVTLSASAVPGPGSDLGVIALDFSVDGEDVGSVVGASGSVVWDTGTLADTIGRHTLTVSARDQNENAGQTSETITLTATNAPVVTITSPTAGASVTGDVTIGGTVRTVTSDAVQTLDILVDGQHDSTVTVPAGVAPGTATWSILWSSGYDAPGQHQVSVQATDPKGLVGISAPVTVTIVAPT